jgi:hypothetical protein
MCHKPTALTKKPCFYLFLFSCLWAPPKTGGAKTKTNNIWPKAKICFSTVGAKTKIKRNNNKTNKTTLQKLIIGYADNNKTTVGALKIKATPPETNKAKPMAFFFSTCGRRPLLFLGGAEK